MPRRERRIRLGNYEWRLTPREEPRPEFVELNRAVRQLVDAVTTEWLEPILRWLNRQRWVLWLDRHLP